MPPQTTTTLHPPEPPISPTLLLQEAFGAPLPAALQIPSPHWCLLLALFCLWSSSPGWSPTRREHVLLVAECPAEVGALRTGRPNFKSQTQFAHL